MAQTLFRSPSHLLKFSRSSYSKVSLAAAMRFLNEIFFDDKSFGLKNELLINKDPVHANIITHS